MDALVSPPPGTALEAYLKDRTSDSDLSTAVTAVISALAQSAAKITELLRRGPLGDTLGDTTGDANADGDVQKKLDLIANDIIQEALAGTGTCYFASEEEDAIVTLDENGSVAVAVDPLDGSSNIDVNVSVGTIFSIYPAEKEGATASFFRPGSEQLAAGYFVYGPHTALIVSTGQGTQEFILDPEDGTFKLVEANVEIVPTTSEFAINASNYRHWREPVRTFIDDCLQGAEGPRGKNFNMRWVASLVAETHRIFSRGGVFLYPGDNRQSYSSGRLRLLYEAAPIAFLVEQAKGGAIDGADRILDLSATELHQRVPLIFGSIEKVERIRNYHLEPGFSRNDSPLFRSRGLFSA